MKLITELLEQQDQLAMRRQAKHDIVRGDAFDKLDHAIAAAVDFLIAGGMKGSDAVKAVVGHMNDVVMAYDLEGASGLGMEEEEESDRAKAIRQQMKLELEREQRSRDWAKKMGREPGRIPWPRPESPEEKREREGT